MLGSPQSRRAPSCTLMQHIAQRTLGSSVFVLSPPNYCKFGGKSPFCHVHWDYQCKIVVYLGVKTCVFSWRICFYVSFQSKRLQRCGGVSLIFSLHTNKMSFCSRYVLIHFETLINRSFKLWDRFPRHTQTITTEWTAERKWAAKRVQSK